MGRALPDALTDYRDKLDALNETGEEMGELAAHVADMADMLSHTPDRFTRAALQGWPTVLDLSDLFARLSDQRKALLHAWAALDPAQQAGQGGLPPFDAPDPSSPVV